MSRVSGHSPDLSVRGVGAIPAMRPPKPETLSGQLQCWLAAGPDCDEVC